MFLKLSLPQMNLGNDHVWCVVVVVVFVVVVVVVFVIDLAGFFT